MNDMKKGVAIMSLLTDYENRTGWKHEYFSGNFLTNNKVLDKVDNEGQYKYFPGTTVVFRLKNDDYKRFEFIQQQMFKYLSGTNMLAMPLPVTSYHMTLHDLVCPDCSMTGFASDGYKEELKKSFNEAAIIVKKIKEENSNLTIKMVEDRFVNIVSCSIGLLLKPASELDYSRLLDLYHRFDSIMKLNYPLTPHITIAYYKPGIIYGEQLNYAFGEMQTHLNNNIIELSVENLKVQYFSNMANYENTFLGDGYD